MGSSSKQNKNRSKFKVKKKKKKKTQMNKNKRVTKQNFLTNLREQLSANPKKPRILQRFLFYSKPNQASQYLKSLVNFQQRRRGFFFRNFQISKKKFLFFAYNKKVQSLSVASVTVSFNDGRRLPLNTPLSGWGRR